MQPLSLPTPSGRPLSVLCLGAHCDDIEIGCGGTLLALCRSRADVAIHWHVFASNAVRGAELERCGELLLGPENIPRITTDAFRDGYMPFDGAAVKDRFEALKREHAPDLIFTHREGDRHQDHALVAQLTANTFRDHLVLGYEVAKYDGDLATPNLYMPLDAADATRKVDAICAAYASQASRSWFAPETFASLMRLRAIECNASAGFAEGFYCRKGVLF